MNKATKTVILTFGLMMSFAGFEHGIGELTQGDVAVSGLFIKSWGESRFFEQVGGEPAMTLVPSMRISGALSMLVALAIAAWCGFFLDKRHAGLVLALLSILLLLVGGGFAPPVMGIMLGLAGGKLRSGFPFMRRFASNALFKLIARIWPFSLGLGMLCFLYLVPVSILLWGFWGIRTGESMVITVSLTALSMIPVSALSAYAHDAINART